MEEIIGQIFVYLGNYYALSVEMREKGWKLGSRNGVVVRALCPTNVAGVRLPDLASHVG